MSNNKVTYLKYMQEFINDGCKEPSSAAIGKMVEDAIRNRTYIVYSEDAVLANCDIIVTFNFAGDPTFGMYQYDSDGEHQMLVSMPDGVGFMDL
jgi:hypothetical protein